jgi:ADP-ribosyl-[dinitrogen reductase] hydrolase
MRVEMSSARPTLSETEQERAVGIVVGAAVGDALGAPFEFRPRGTYRAVFPEPVHQHPAEMIGGGSFDWAPGEFTDDTQMGMALAETLRAERAYDADVVWTWFRTWARTARDVGVTTSRALVHTDWRRVPDSPHGAGNGALMRCFPLALAFRDADEPRRREIALHHAALTHKDPAAGWGSWIALEMMRAGLHGDDPLGLVPALVDALPADVRGPFVELLAPTWTPDDRRWSNGTVWGCLAQAVWALRSTDGYEDAVVAAVSLGDDADTVACVTGALAGARYGRGAIPSRWTAAVHGSIASPGGPITYAVDDLAASAVELAG